MTKIRTENKLKLMNNYSLNNLILILLKRQMKFNKHIKQKNTKNALLIPHGEFFQPLKNWRFKSSIYLWASLNEL